MDPSADQRRSPKTSHGRKTDECVITKSIRQELMDDYVWNSLIDVLKQSHTIKEKTKKGGCENNE